MPRHLQSIALVLLCAAVSSFGAQPGVPIEHKSPVLCLAWSADGRRLATGTHDGTIRIGEAATGKELHSLATGHPVAGMAFSPDGGTLAIAQVGQTMSAWEVATGKRLRTGGFPNYKPDQLAFTSDGQSVVAAGIGEFVQWRMNGGASGSKSGVLADGCATVSPDGRLSAWSDGKGLLRVREYEPQNRTMTLQVGSARSIAFGPEGKRLAVGDDQGVHLWDWTAQKKTTTLTELKRPAVKLSISADGQSLAALADDGTSLRLWDLKDNRSRRQINHPGRVAALALSPNGKLLATTGTDGKVHLWNALARELTHKGPPLELAPAELAGLWTDLGNADSGKVEAAWQKLAGARDNAIPFLQRQIRPIAVPSVDRKQIGKLLAELDSDTFAIREKATADLIAVGEPALGLVKRYLEKPASVEAERRANLVLEKLGEPALTPERLRVLEAIALLEQVRTAKAIGLLEEIDRDALVPQIRREARQALDRIAQSPEKK